jgi:hypothetical protein
MQDNLIDKAKNGGRIIEGWVSDAKKMIIDNSNRLWQQSIRIINYQLSIINSLSLDPVDIVPPDDDDRTEIEEFLQLRLFSQHAVILLAASSQKR